MAGWTPGADYAQEHLDPFVEDTPYQDLGNTMAPDFGDYKENPYRKKYAHVSPDEVAINVAFDNPEYFQLTPGYMAVDKTWLLEQWDLLSKQPWFRGFQVRNEAETELRPQRPGSFVVRVSQSQPGHYAISAIQADGAFEHMLILPTVARTPGAPGNTRYRLGSKSLNLFNTVPKLIAYYNNHPYHSRHYLIGEVITEKQKGGYVEVGVGAEPVEGGLKAGYIALPDVPAGYF